MHALGTPQPATTSCRDIRGAALYAAAPTVRIRPTLPFGSPAGCPSPASGATDGVHA
jgi:hypothetical protein